MHRCRGLLCFHSFPCFFFFGHHFRGRHLNQAVKPAVTVSRVYGKTATKCVPGFLFRSLTVAMHDAKCHVRVTAVGVGMASGVSYVLAMCSMTRIWASLYHACECLSLTLQG